MICSRYFFSLLAVLLLNSFVSGQVQFLPSLDVATEIAQKNDLAVMLFIHKKEQKASERLLASLHPEEISNIINQSFLTVREEDIDLSLDLRFKYEIEEVPTLLFIDKNGEELGKIVGYKDDKNTEKDIKGMARRTTGLADLRREYMSSKSDNDLLRSYYDQLRKYGFDRDAERLIVPYFTNLSKSGEDPDLSFVLNATTHYRLQSFTYVLDNLKVFDDSLSYGEINEVLTRAVVDNISETKKDDLRYIETRMKSIFSGTDYHRFLNHHVLSSYANRVSEADQQTYFEYGRKALGVTPCEEDTYYNDIVVSMMLKNSNEDFLTELVTSLQKCLSITNSVNSMDILSVIKYKKGDKTGAIALVNEARKIALDQGRVFKSSLKYFKELGFLQ